MSKNRNSFLSTLTWLDWLLTILAIFAIGYGLLRAEDLDPARWSYIAGPLFALSSSFLFVLALRVQLREHRQAIDEMVQNNDNHSQLLQVARNEKEFTVCLQAIQHAKEKLDSFKFNGQVGITGVRQAIEEWLQRVKAPAPNLSYGRRRGLFSVMLNTEDVFPMFNELDELNVHIYWVLHAVNKKDLALDDRRYLNTLITPIIREIGKAQTMLPHVIQEMEALLMWGDDKLSAVKVDRDTCRYHLKAVKQLYDRRYPSPA